MIPDASEITRRRVTAATVLRLLAITAFLIAFIPIGAWIIPGIIDGDLFELDYYMYPLVTAVFIFIVASITWLVSPWLARLSVPVPRNKVCPACLYRIEGLNTPQCPECGLSLTDEFLSNTRPLHQLRHASNTVYLRQIVAAILRVVAAITAFIMLISIAFMAVVHVTYGYTQWSEYAGPVIAILAAAPLYLLAPPLASRIVLDRGSMRAPDSRRALGVCVGLAGGLLALASLWLLTDEKGSPFPVVMLLVGCGLVVAAFPIAQRPRQSSVPIAGTPTGSEADDPGPVPDRGPETQGSTA
ncbi:MAG: hypothetical protein H6810_04070 [Phycisphaeraceae bacterium]|nr:MAG: hypothetical protein H6810_04070 [Phycisphaeraceae bacterium]